MGNSLDCGCLDWMTKALGSSSSSEDTNTTKKINSKYYRILTTLGSGGFATVFRARDLSNSREVALKRVRFASEKRHIVEQEVKFLSIADTRLKCPFIIRLVDSETTSSSTNGVNVPHQNPGTPSAAAASSKADAAAASLASSSFDGECWMVLELCGASIFDILQERIGQMRLMQRVATSGAARVKIECVLPLDVVVQAMHSLVSAIAALHSHDPPIANWDVKLQNLLMVPPGGSTTAQFKLCDFGSATDKRVPPCANAKAVTAASVILEERMTAAYRPPEAYDLWQRHAVGTGADLWAIGVCLYTMICSRLPFEEGNPREVIDLKICPFPESVQKSDNDFYPLYKMVTEGLLVEVQQRWNIWQLSERLATLYPAVHKKIPAPQQQASMGDFLLTGVDK